MKKMFLLFASLAVFSGCSKDADQSGYTAKDLDGNAFLAISLANGAADSRAANQEFPGSENESKVALVTVLLFDETNTCLGVRDYTGVVVGNSNGAGQAAAASEPQLVPADTKTVFVVINNVGWDLSATAVEGKTWAQINKAMDAQITAIAPDGRFVMTSAGSFTHGGLSAVAIVQAASKEPSDITAAKDAAKAQAAMIKIDRMAAKVGVATNMSGVTVPAGVTFEFLGWEMSVTNKSTQLYSEIVRYDDATTTATPGIYRKDKNYLKSEQPDFANPAEMKAAFDYLTNEPLSTVGRTGGTTAYCLENTMEASAQQLGVTTKVVVRAKYAPENWPTTTSYFLWSGNFFKLADLQAAYASHLAGTGLKKDLPIFLKKANIYTDADDSAAKMDAFVAALTADQFTATSGITGRYCAVRYYHESVCYYDVLVFHDQSVTTEMALGRYGVVRNNWYSLSIDKASKPGTPWISDPSDPDPSNPTTPDTDDDKGNAYLSVQMTINPWTFWTQGVELN